MYGPVSFLKIRNLGRIEKIGSVGNEVSENVEGQGKYSTGKIHIKGKIGKIRNIGNKEKIGNTRLQCQTPVKVKPLPFPVQKFSSPEALNKIMGLTELFGLKKLLV